MRKGILSAVGAYIIWGFIPLFFKQLQTVPAIHVTMHRIIWSFVLLLGVIFISKQHAIVIKNFNLRTLALYSLAAILIAINWFTYVWGVNNGYVVETSLGYFINPLVSVILGILIFKEKPRPLQWLPIALAVLGIIYLTSTYGSLPWISLILATSFGLYGLIKKMARLPAMVGLTIETGILFIPALVYILIVPAPVLQAGLPGSGTLILLLIASGALTALPLFLFAVATPRIPLSMVGLLQYIAPSIQFLIGIYIFREPFNNSKLIGFIMIWIALIILTFEGITHHKRAIRLQTESG